MSILVWFQKSLYFWNENKKLDWMNSTNVQNLRKNSNANVLQIFAFALQIWVTIWASKAGDKRNVFTLWQEFRSQCRGQIQMDTLNEREGSQKITWQGLRLSSYYMKNTCHSAKIFKMNEWTCPFIRQVRVLCAQ